VTKDLQEMYVILNFVLKTAMETEVVLMEYANAEMVILEKAVQLQNAIIIAITMVFAKNQNVFAEKDLLEMNVNSRVVLIHAKEMEFVKKENVFAMKGSKE